MRKLLSLIALLPFAALAQFPVVVGPDQAFQGVEGTAAASTGPIPVISASVAASPTPGSAAAAGSASSVNNAAALGTHTPTVTNTQVGASSVLGNTSASQTAGAGNLSGSLNIATGDANAAGSSLFEVWQSLP